MRLLLLLNSPEGSLHVFDGLSVLLLTVLDSGAGPTVVEPVAVSHSTVFPPGLEILQDQFKTSGKYQTPLQTFSKDLVCS